MGIVAAVNVSAGGVPKMNVGGARMNEFGLEGDGHRNLKFHGGLDRAACLFSLELIEALKMEGHPISPGALGENLTLSGLHWDSITPGVKIKIGNALLCVTSFTMPCFTIKRFFRDGRFGRVSQKSNPGWSRVYARVVEPGFAAVGDVAEIVWTAVA